MRKLAVVSLAAFAMAACAEEANSPLAPDAPLLAAATVEVTGDVAWTVPSVPTREATASFAVITQRDNLRGKVAATRSDGVDWYSDVVTCFAQVNNSAVFAGPITGGTDAGRYYQVRVTDNGDGGSGVRDRINTARSNDPLSCSTGLLPATSEVHTGNLKLHQH
jgi:hypothetical protein